MGCLKGRVKSGFGKGKYYIEQYKEKIVNYLGFEPFLGTLNLQIALEERKFLLQKKPILIEEPNHCNAKCYMIRINNTPAAVIVPDLTEHPESIIEIISPHFLREKFDLKDDDQLEVEL